jgi:hypothetical protein
MMPPLSFEQETVLRLEHFYQGEHEFPRFIAISRGGESATLTI